ncbi:MAG: alpha-glycosidase, partial [Epulopiscium sp.]|nr:alpha-glycosidase [Candidatus Epulonipiscium sp.]
MDLLLNFIKMNYTQKLITYMSTVKEYINEKAVFSDETANFRDPVEPRKDEPVKVKLRTAKNNVDEVFVHFKGQKAKMIKTIQDEIFDYYEGVIPPCESTTSYFFELIK